MIIDGTSKNEKFNKLREEEKIQICPMLQGARVHVWSGPREVKNHFPALVYMLQLTWNVS